jgi:hypothetical protein
MSEKGFHTNSPKIKRFRVKALRILEKCGPAHLLKYKNRYADFWTDYCQTFGIDYQKFIVDEHLQKKANKSLRDIKSKHANKEKTEEHENYIIRKKTITRKVIKNKKPIELNTVEIPNQSVIVKDEEETTEVVTEKMHIQKINFAHAITLATVRRIQDSAEFKEFFTKDYLYFLAGGKEDTEKMKDGRLRKRFKDQLAHLQNASEMRIVLNQLIEKLVQESKEPKVDAVLLNAIDRRINIMKKAMDMSRELDMQPILMLNAIEEGEFSAQKVLQGAITNDRAMVDNGQVVLVAQKQAVMVNEDIDAALKAVSEAIIDKQIESIAEPETELTAENDNDREPTIEELEQDAAINP